MKKMTVRVDLQGLPKVKALARALKRAVTDLARIESFKTTGLEKRRIARHALQAIVKACK